MNWELFKASHNHKCLCGVTVKLLETEQEILGFNSALKNIFVQFIQLDETIF